MHCANSVQYVGGRSPCNGGRWHVPCCTHAGTHGANALFLIRMSLEPLSLSISPRLPLVMNNPFLPAHSHRPTTSIALSLRRSPVRALRARRPRPSRACSSSGSTRILPAQNPSRRGRSPAPVAPAAADRHQARSASTAGSWASMPATRASTAATSGCTSATRASTSATWGRTVAMSAWMSAAVTSVS